MQYPPDDLTLEVRRWLADEFYPQYVGERWTDLAGIVWIDGSMGWVALWQSPRFQYDPPRQRMENLKHVLAERILRVKRGLPPDPLPEPLPPLPVTPRPGHVRLDRRTFVDDAGPFCACIFTHMNGLRVFDRDRSRFIANCQSLYRVGAHAQRVLGMLSWSGREVDPRRSDYHDWLIAMIDEAYEEGLRTELTIFADCDALNMAMPERRDHAAKVARALRGREHKLLFLEGSNEPGHGVNGPWTPEELIEIGQIVKEILPNVLYACGAPFGDPSGATQWTHEVYEALGTGADLVTPHFDRDISKHDEVWRPIRQPIDGHNEGFAFANNEPIGPRSSVAQEANPARLRAAATFTWMCRGASYCYHSASGTGLDHRGQFVDTPIAIEPGLTEVFQGTRVLDLDTPSMTFHNWHWTSNPWDTVDGSLSDHSLTGRGTLRTISATKDDRVQTHVLLVTAGATLKARQAMQGEWLIGHDGRDNYELFGGIRVLAGQSIELGPCVDAIFKGRFI